MTRKIVARNDRIGAALKSANKQKRRYAFEDPKILARANAIRIAKKTWPRELRVAKISDAIVSAAKRDLGI